MSEGLNRLKNSKRHLSQDFGNPSTIDRQHLVDVYRSLLKPSNSMSGNELPALCPGRLPQPALRAPSFNERRNTNSESKSKSFLIQEAKEQFTSPFCRPVAASRAATASIHPKESATPVPSGGECSDLLRRPLLSKQSDDLSDVVRKSKKSDDLVASMAARLRQLEKVSASRLVALQENEKKMKSLEDERNDALQELKDNESGNLTDVRYELLKEQCESYRKRVDKLTEILSKREDDVTATGGSSKGSQSPPQKSSVMSLSRLRNELLPPIVPFDLKKFLRFIHDMNDGVTSDSKVVNSGGVHRLVNDVNSVSIIFFNDGMILYDSEFAPYSSTQSQGILRDLQDGYFPFYLNKAFPDGVALRPIDRVDTVYEDFVRKNGVIYEASDTIVGPNRNRKSQGKTEDVLKSIPERVINKNGDIVPIRANVAKRFLKVTQDNKLIHGKAAQVAASEAAEKRLAVISQDSAAGCYCPPPQEQAPLDKHGHLKNVHKPDFIVVVEKNKKQETENTVLRLRLPGGSDMTGQCSPSVRIGHIKTALLEMAGARLAAVDETSVIFKAGFPPVELADSVTVESAGLHPKATIFVESQ